MPEKGPPVYLDYDQAALDAAYDQAAYAPNREQLIKRRISESELMRLRIGEPERVAYGPTEIERLDIYRAGRAMAPVFVFIHGGAWRSGRSKDFATPAEMFLAAGAQYVVPDFAWVQDVGGSLMVLADQVRRAVAWVYQNSARIGCDPNRLYVGGQPSGGVRNDARLGEIYHGQSPFERCRVASASLMAAATGRQSEARRTPGRWSRLWWLAKSSVYSVSAEMGKK
jgi:hypothetical protein